MINLTLIGNTKEANVTKTILSSTETYITTNVGTAKLRDGSVYLNPEYVNITTSLKRNRESIENELPIPPFSPFKD